MASIYGMNFRSMPELEWTLVVGDCTLPLGYLFAIGLMLLFSGATFWFFKYKKWL